MVFPGLSSNASFPWQAVFVDSRNVDRKDFIERFGEELAEFLIDQVQKDAK